MEGEIFGFVGVGKMGTPMSTRLLAAGKKVCVYDRDEQAIAGMVKAGAQRITCPLRRSIRLTHAV